MHDTAVESANFTECVPAPTGEGSSLPATEGRWTRSQPITLQRRPPARRRPLRWHQTCERSPDRAIGCRLGCGMIRFNNCLWATLQDVRNT